MSWKTLDDMDFAGKVALVRVDINVPVEAGQVTDATRIEKIVPTVKDIIAKGGMPVLLAHFGRPKGKVVPEMSLKVTLPALEKALGQPVTFVFTDWQSAPAVAAKPGTVTLMETNRLMISYVLNAGGLRVLPRVQDIGTTTAPAVRRMSGIRSALTSASMTSRPTSRRACATRRPERSDTSRSWLNPPAITMIVMDNSLSGDVR